MGTPCRRPRDGGGVCSSNGDRTWSQSCEAVALSFARAFASTYLRLVETGPWGASDVPDASPSRSCRVHYGFEATTSWEMSFA
jgi:hypothetical protein